MVHLSSLLLLNLLAAFTLAGYTARQTIEFDVLSYVDPLIGSRSGGNVFAGATLPYGMAKGKSTRNI
jgi:hypothetical protein